MCMSALSGTMQRNVDRSSEHLVSSQKTFLDSDWSSGQFHTFVSASCGNRPPCVESARAASNCKIVAAAAAVVVVCHATTKHEYPT